MAQQEVEVLQYWIRNDKGKVWGPLTFATIEMFMDNQVVPGRVQASFDGENFADPGRFPDVRDAFPKDMWGSTEPLPPTFARPSTSTGSPPALRPGAPAARPAGPPVVGRASAPPAAPAGRPGAAPAAPAGRSGAAPAVAPAAAPKAAAPTAPAGPQADLETVPPSGLLRELGPIRLYYLLAAGNGGGRLSVEVKGTTYNLLFKRGVVQQIRSSNPADSVVRYLSDNRLIGPNDGPEVELAAAQYGGDPIAAAFALNKVKNPGAMIGALSAHGQVLLAKVLLAQEGSFHYDASASPPPGAVALGEKWKLLTQSLRTMTGDQARARLGESMDNPVMKAEERVAVGDMGLNAQEARVAAMFEGVKSPAQLAEAVGDADLVARVCFLLGEVGLASFAGVKVSNTVSAPAAPTPPAAAAWASAPEPETLEEPAPDLEPLAPEEASPPASPPPAAPAKPAPRPSAPPSGGPPKLAPQGGPPKLTPSAPKLGAAGPPKLTPSTPRVPAAPRPATAAAPRPATAPGGPRPGTAPVVAAAPAKPPPPLDPVSLDALVTTQSKQNHFEVLGLQQNATAAQVKAAYLYSVKHYHPDSTPPDAPPEVRPLKEQIFARINEANNVLSDEQARAQYLDDLEHGGDEKVDVQAIFKAEEIFTRACIVVKARKYPEALKMFDEALALNDQEAEFHAWRAWAAFMTASDRKAALAGALGAEQKALKLNARCAPAAFFSGQMLKLAGDNPAALKWFVKTLELDPNHLEAKSEVRALGGKA